MWVTPGDSVLQSLPGQVGYNKGKIHINKFACKYLLMYAGAFHLWKSEENEAVPSTSKVARFQWGTGSPSKPF